MVSILVAAYNCEKTILPCLESIAEQSYQDVEVIVVDDGSTDQTGSICKTFSEHDPRFRVIHQPNDGLSAARNTGLQAAKGEYITFVDADDLMMPDAVEKLISKTEDGAELVVGSYVEFRGRYRNNVVHPNRTWRAEDFVSGFQEIDAFLNFNWGKLYSREIIQRNGLYFDSGLAWGEDHAFNLAYLKNICHVTEISELVYRYRLGGVASSVRYYPNKAQLNLALMKYYESFFEDREQTSMEHLKRVLKQQLTSSVVHYLIHCPGTSANEKIGDTLCAFQCYLNSDYIDFANYSRREAQAYLTQNERAIVREVYRRQWRKIAKRKTKKILNQIKRKCRA